jgi:hypothetical protein
MGSPTQDPTAPGAATSPGASRLRDDPTPDDQSPADTLKDISARLAELREYISYYLAAKADGLKISLRNLGVYAALGVVGLMAGGAFVVTLVVLLLRGIAGGLGALFHDRLWAGELVTAVLFLALMAVGVMFAMKKLTGSSRERTVKKYASRQQQQRAQFGTDVEQRAKDPAE